MEDGAIIHVDYDLFSGETGDLIPFCDPTDEQAMGNFSQEGFLGV